MTLFGCTNKNIGAYTQIVPRFLPQLGHRFGVFFDRLLGGRSRTKGFLRILIRAGCKQYPVAVLAVVARQDIGRNGGVSMADMWAIVYVVDRRGYKNFSFFGFSRAFLIGLHRPNLITTKGVVTGLA